MNEKLWEGKLRRYSVFKGREESSSVSVHWPLFMEPQVWE